MNGSIGRLDIPDGEPFICPKCGDVTTMEEFYSLPNFRGIFCKACGWGAVKKCTCNDCKGL